MSNWEEGEGDWVGEAMEVEQIKEFGGGSRMEGYHSYHVEKVYFDVCFIEYFIANK